MAGRDRVYFEFDNREKVSRWKNAHFLGLESASENKDILFLTMVLGMDNPKPLNKKNGWILYKALNTADKAMVRAAKLGAEEITDDNVNQVSDFDKCMDYVEACSNRGIDKLSQMIEENHENNDELEAILMRELDKLYSQNVEEVKS
ncbi:hypothetical protein [uncultured Dialister sp.]|uniref:hypothetical protein n=1 Tax=uncultured Dialister sp. TaxID=278064 RepID=UPI002658CDF8|nr:hypothetical protein [uncultured Dialister sp.]